MPDSSRISPPALSAFIALASFSSRAADLTQTSAIFSLGTMTTPSSSALTIARDRDTGVRPSLGRSSRLFPGDRRFRHFARFDRNLLQAIDKPSAGGAKR